MARAETTAGSTSVTSDWSSSNANPFIDLLVFGYFNKTGTVLPYVKVLWTVPRTLMRRPGPRCHWALDEEGEEAGLQPSAE